MPRSLSGAVVVGAGAGGVGLLKKSASVNAVAANAKAIGSIVAKVAEEKITPAAARPNNNHVQQNNNPNNNAHPIPHPYDSLDFKDIAQHRTPSSSSSSSSSSSDHKRLPAPNQHQDHKMMRQVVAEDFPTAAVAEDKKGLGLQKKHGYKHGYNKISNRDSIDSDVLEEEEEEEEDERLNQSVELHSTLVGLSITYFLYSM